MEDDWDLHAVVRGCSSAITTATAASSSTTTAAAASSGQILSTFGQDCSFSATWFQDLFEPRRDDLIGDLHDLYKPFFPKSQEPSQIDLISSQSLPISPLSVFNGLQDLSSEQQQQQQQQQQVIRQFPQQKQQLFSVVNGSKPSTSSHFPSPRSKKRKNHLKRVCHVPAESLSSDKWSWRKYGQKPIKGSPYPRGYYRCSTSKGCIARKQVERNRSDTGMFIVTYAGEHNHPMPTHRNSLAGSTRQKPAETPNSDDSKKSSCSPEMSPAASVSPAPERLESSREDLAEVEDDDDDDDFSASKMALDDDFFAGLEDFTRECLSDHIPANSQFPWLANNATTTTTTTAAGGG